MRRGMHQRFVTMQCLKHVQKPLVGLLCPELPYVLCLEGIWTVHNSVIRQDLSRNSSETALGQTAADQKSAMRGRSGVS